MSGVRYETLFLRIIANTEEPTSEQGCWIWKKRKDRWGYGRMEVYIPGLGKTKTLMVHLVSWLWLEAKCENANDLWLAYREFRESGLELDHTCVNSACCRPDCLEPVPGKINNQRKLERILEKRK
jgi:hypothetical protein